MIEPTALLIFRNGSIGNTLMAVPALRALRAAFPKSRISVVVDPIGEELLKHCQYVDDLIVYDKHGRDNGLVGAIRVVRKLRAARPSHAILFKRFFRNGLLAFLSGAKVRAGFISDGTAPFLNVTTPYDLVTHIAQLNLRLVALLGAKSNDDRLEVFLTDEDRSAARAWRDENGLSKSQYVCAHYGGVSVGSKFMPIEIFAELLEAKRFTLQVVFIGSGTDERDAAASLQRLLPGSKLAVNLPLRTTIALLEQSVAFAGFNSGPAHLAAACRRPGLVIFPDDVYRKDSVRWRPLFEDLRVLSAQRDLSLAQWREWIDHSPPLIP